MEYFKYYRYGFNGKENDNEVKGTGNQQDYGMRIYDPRVGRFLSTDPLSKEYPWYTPYKFAGNTPIQAIDRDGLEPASVVSVKYRESIVRTQIGPVNLAVYRFTDVAAHLLSFVSGVPEADIAKVEIVNGKGTIVPAYDPLQGGGGITFPSNSNEGGKYQMNLTDNYFTDYWSNKNSYGQSDKSNNVDKWLEQSSHEVEHIKDIT